MTTPYGSNVSLTTTFPSRQLDNESPDTSLRQAGLVPSTTILILPRSSGGRIVSTSADGSIMSYIWLLLTPLTALWGLINSIFASSQPSDSGNPNENRKRQANSDSTSGS